MPLAKRVNICNIPVDVLTMDETLELIDGAIVKGESLRHCAVNAAKIVNALKSDALRESIVDCDIINADGKAIVWASKLLNQPLPERVAGIDLMQRLVYLASKRNYKIFFFGGKEEVVRKVVDKYSNLYGQQIIAGFRNGYYTQEEEGNIASEIGSSGADILFVAITSPKKEIFLNTYSSKIKVPFTMGVGGSFDVVAGLVKRAPLWMQNSGLEWFFRVIQEPTRLWKRYLVTNSAFIYLILREKFFPPRTLTRKTSVQ
jgi:N-acetylglucosaminyldiphosphoundecaprenol N-acetyl-beta-D-mannosaminyltransferase